MGGEPLADALRANIRTCPDMSRTLDRTPRGLVGLVREVLVRCDLIVG